MYAHGPRDAAARPAAGTAAAARHRAAPPPAQPPPAQGRAIPATAGRQLNVWRDPTDSELEEEYGSLGGSSCYSDDDWDSECSEEQEQEEGEEGEEEAAEQEGGGEGEVPRSGGDSGSSATKGGAINAAAATQGGSGATPEGSGAAGEAQHAARRDTRRAQHVARQAERERREMEREERRAQKPALPDRLVSQQFLHLCWCEPCRRGFVSPRALLDHCRGRHAGSERIAALEAERACPCGRSFASVGALSSHIQSLHNTLTPGQAQADGMLRVLMARGGFGGVGGGWSSGDDDSDDGGMCGFTGAEVEELLCQGVKPWDDDAFAVMGALYGDDLDYF